MLFQSIFTTLIAAACMTGAGATAVSLPRAVDLTARAGCGSAGPLGTGHFKWFIDTSCKPGGRFLCQAMDGSGCEPGGTKKIGSIEVDDPNDTFQVARATHSNSLSFVCPAGGQVRCQINLEDNDDGPSYSLRVIS